MQQQTVNINPHPSEVLFQRLVSQANSGFVLISVLPADKAIPVGAALVNTLRKLMSAPSCMFPSC